MSEEEAKIYLRKRLPKLKIKELENVCLCPECGNELLNPKEWGKNSYVCSKCKLQWTIKCNGRTRL